MVDTPGRLKSATLGDAGYVGVVEGACLFEGLVSLRAIQLATLSAGGAICGRVYCAAANTIGYRLSRPTPAAKADNLVGSTTCAKFMGQVGLLESYPQETPAFENDVLNIATPLQVFHGEFVPFVSVSNSKQLADLLTNSRFAVIEGASHYARENASEGYVARMLAFISDIETETGSMIL